MASTKNRFVYATSAAWGLATASDYDNSIVFIHDGGKGVKIYTHGTYFKTDFTLDDIKALIGNGNNVTFRDVDGKLTIDVNGLAAITASAEDDTKLVTQAAVKGAFATSKTVYVPDNAADTKTVTVKNTLTSLDGKTTADSDVKLTAGTNVTFKVDSANGITINSSDTVYTGDATSFSTVDGKTIKNVTATVAGSDAKDGLATAKDVKAYVDGAIGGVDAGVVSHTATGDGSFINIANDTTAGAVTTTLTTTYGTFADGLTGAIDGVATVNKTATFVDSAVKKIDAKVNGASIKATPDALDFDLATMSGDYDKDTNKLATANDIATALTSSLVYKGDIDASATHVFPSDAKAGDVYVVSVAGTIGASTVEVGDTLICKKAKSTADADWTILNKNWSVDNKNAVITANAGTATTIATIGGVDITAQVTAEVPNVTVTDAGSTDEFVSKLATDGHGISATRAKVVDAKMVGYTKPNGMVTATDDIKGAIKKLDDAWDWMELK